MRVVIQRVLEAKVEVDGISIGEIGKGLLVFLGIHKEDKKEDANWLALKIASLRIFPDDKHRMNLSVQEAQANVLIVSQFTLYGNCQSGRRPDFFDAALPAQAEELYLYFIDQMKSLIPHVQTGRFGADMKVSLINDGPVTFVIDSKK